MTIERLPSFLYGIILTGLPGHQSNSGTASSPLETMGHLPLSTSRSFWSDLDSLPGLSYSLSTGIVSY